MSIKNQDIKNEKEIIYKTDHRWGVMSYEYKILNQSTKLEHIATIGWKQSSSKKLKQNPRRKTNYTEFIIQPRILDFIKHKSIMYHVIKIATGYKLVDGFSWMLTILIPINEHMKGLFKHLHVLRRQIQSQKIQY